MITIGEALLVAENELKGISETPKLDAKVLMKEVLKKDDLFLLMNRMEIMEESHVDQFSDMVDKRKTGEPIAYIIGYKEFMGFRFKVTEDTLIPRPDTEVSVEEAIRVIKERGYKDVLDLCSGSGAIGLSIAKILDFTNVSLSDINKGALLVSMENAEALGLKDKVRFFESDLFEKVSGTYDLIVSNPPYISGEDMERLPESVKNFEPETALFGGISGLDFYQKIIREARQYLNDGGTLIFEIGYDQREEVEKMFIENGYNNLRTLKDLSGLDRVVSGTLVPET